MNIKDQKIEAFRKLIIAYIEYINIDLNEKMTIEDVVNYSLFKKLK